MQFGYNPVTHKLDLVDVVVPIPGDVVSITGNSGGAVDADGSGNINLVGSTNIAVAGNPGTNTLTIQMTSPLPIIQGGTNATSMTTTDGVIYYDGTRLVTTAAGTSTYVLTSNGAGNAPTFQVSSGGSGITTLVGDTGTATGSSVTIYANTSAKNCGATVNFSNVSATSTLNFSDLDENTAIGYGAGGSLVGSSGANNTIVGNQAGNSMTTPGPDGNTGIGRDAFFSLTLGSYNTGVGINVAANLITGTYNTAIGENAGGNWTSTESKNIAIGCRGAISESQIIRIGDSTADYPASSCFIGGIYGVTVGGGTAVLAGSNGQLGTVLSAQKYKENIEDLGESTSNLHNLRPVSFNYKGDQTKELHYGLIAEEVNVYFPDLVVYDSNNEIFSIKYHEMPAILLNEIKKLKDKVDILEKKIN